MKKIILIIVFLFAYLTSQAQEQKFLWPIKGAIPGSNILYNFQDFIGQEKVVEGMFIGADEGTVILSPVDGIVERAAVVYYSSLQYVGMWGGPEGLSLDSLISRVKSRKPKNVDLNYITGSISIISGRYEIHISGFTGSEVFKDGQKIKRGDPIGKVGYSYYKIEQPAIRVSMTRSGKVTDPLTPFGIK